MKTLFIFIGLFTFVNLSIFAQSFGEEELELIREEAEHVMQEYIAHSASIGDTQYEYAVRAQSFGKAFLKCFSEPDNATICTNDLDPTGTTSKTHSPKDYLSNMLTWYNKGFTVRFLTDYNISTPKQNNGVWFVSVKTQKEIGGIYNPEGKYFRKRYDLEFLISFKRNNGVMTDFRIGKISVTNGNTPAPVVNDEPKTAEDYYVKGDEYYQRGDYTQALPFIKKAADLGLAKAQNRIGYMYRNGYGVTQDYYEAVKWYRKAAEQGDALGQSNLGYMYEKGYSVRQDYSEAVKWYRKAAEQGDARGQSNLGVMYENGYGVTQDYTEAVKWYRKAAVQGNARAQNNLVTMYFYGYGVTLDYSEAVKWYRKAAEQGNAIGQSKLGDMYENRSVERHDYSEWFKA